MYTSMYVFTRCKIACRINSIQTKASNCKSNHTRGFYGDSKMYMHYTLLLQFANLHIGKCGKKCAIVNSTKRRMRSRQQFPFQTEQKQPSFYQNKLIEKFSDQATLSELCLNYIFDDG